ncbi:MAG: HAMP domain-containing protein [Planctomycetes bacterium]|nr:HAMP domain-containing protein [Planctomycetota bacterium]
MRIVHKLSLGFLFVALMIWVAGGMAARMSRQVLQEAIEDSTVAFAGYVLDTIDTTIGERIEDIQVQATVLEMSELLAKSNKEFEQMDDVAGYVQQQDQEWTSAPRGTLTPFMKDIIDNSLSRELQAKAKFYEGKHGHSLFAAAFVTNRFGVVVAAAQRTSDYRQDDEQWWQCARANGVYVGDIGYDESAETYAICIAIRVNDEEGRFIGVKKAELSIQQFVEIVSEMRSRKLGRGFSASNYWLLTKEGNVIYSTRDHNTLEPAPDYLSHLRVCSMSDEHADSSGENADEGAVSCYTDANEDALVVCTRSRGHGDFKGLGWLLLVKHDAKDVFAPVNSLRRRISCLSLAVTIIGLVIGFVVASPIGGRITGLRNATVEISNGNLDARVDASGKDEISELAKCFNRMAGQVKESTQALRARTAALERSNSELQAFAHVASHDLQEPLRKVEAFGTRLKDKCGDALDDRGRDYLERMQDAVRRMRTLINDLLTFSRVTSKAQPFRQVDLKKIAHEVLSDLEVRIEETGGKVEVGGLPTIDADPMQMRQLLQNLIGNALKFHRDEEPPIVKVDAQPIDAQEQLTSTFSDGGYRISVSDNGIGFDEKYSDRIFGVFQRLHGRGEFEGSGMGLAVVRKIVDRHGGAVTVDSAPGKGCTFNVLMPAVQQNKEKEENGQTRNTHHDSDGG